MLCKCYGGNNTYPRYFAKNLKVPTAIDPIPYLSGIYIYIYILFPLIAPISHYQSHLAFTVLA